MSGNRTHSPLHHHEEPQLHKQDNDDPAPQPADTANTQDSERGRAVDEHAEATQDVSQVTEAETTHAPFQPLFTLLTNSTTNSTIHPRVRYLFSDDDTSILSEAQSDPSVRPILVDLAPASAVAASPSHHHPPPPPSSQQLAGAGSSSSIPLPGGNTSWCVSWASSLDPSFAITASSISSRHNSTADEPQRVPSGATKEAQHQQHAGDQAFRRGQNDDLDASPALMLQVEGVEREPVVAKIGNTSLPSSASGGAAASEDLDALAEDFGRRMGVLKRVVGQGEKRRSFLGQQGDAALGQEQVRESESESTDRARPEGK